MGFFSFRIFGTNLDLKEYQNMLAYKGVQLLPMGILKTVLRPDSTKQQGYCRWETSALLLHQLQNSGMQIGVYITK